MWVADDSKRSAWDVVIINSSLPVYFVEPPFNYTRNKEGSNEVIF